VYAAATGDKPALAVTRSAATARGGNGLGELRRHCDGLVVGSTAGVRTPCRTTELRNLADPPQVEPARHGR
jgi:hypothetical protein